MAQPHAGASSSEQGVGSRGALAAAALGSLLVLAGCSHRPPPDFAPDPGLVARITSIRIDAPSTACPGQTIPASYTAVLDDGSEIPFATSYDKHHPPRLHVVFLVRYSPNAVAREDGDWDTYTDPLLSAMNGFPLRVSLKAKPSVVAETRVVPEYSCLQHAFAFAGPSGEIGQSGAAGPPVTVRLAVLRSPFVARLLVADVAVGDAPPFYVFADVAQVPPSDWLIVESSGGRGGHGTNGRKGKTGADGTPGCPGSAGGPGGDGGDGSVGGDGGPGGSITVIAPEEEPFLAGIVDARSPGGDGGTAGRAGAGGDGGKGGAAQGSNGRRCAAGADGPDGRDGRPGRDGRDGPPGPRPQVITVPAANVFGTNPPPELVSLINYHARERQ